jgi:hypothetical protein
MQKMGGRVIRTMPGTSFDSRISLRVARPAVIAIRVSTQLTSADYFPERQLHLREFFFCDFQRVSNATESNGCWSKKLRAVSWDIRTRKFSREWPLKSRRPAVGGPSRGESSKATAR